MKPGHITAVCALFVLLCCSVADYVCVALSGKKCVYLSASGGFSIHK